MLSNTELINDYFSYIREENLYQEKTIVSIESVLNKFADYGDMIGKSVLQFVYQDFINMFINSKWTSRGVFDTRKTIIGSFLMYCYETNKFDSEMYAMQYMSAFKGIYPKSFDSSAVYKSDYYKTIQDLIDVIKYNVVSKEDLEDNANVIATLYLVWYGLTLDDIVNLESSDFDGTHLYVKSKDKVYEIKEQEVIDILTYLKNNLYYIVGRRDSRSPYKIVPYKNQDVLLKSKSTKSDGKVLINSLRSSVSTFNGRITEGNVSSKFYGKSIRLDAIKKNGLYTRIKELEDKYNLEIVQKKDKRDIIDKLDELLQGELKETKTNKEATVATKVHKTYDGYLKWRKVYYGY